MQDKEPEKESEVPKYLPKEGTPAFAIIRALRNEIPHCLQKDELKEVAQPFCAESFKETGSSSAWEATTILLKKKIISKSKKGSSEFYTLTEKGEELADLMGADEEECRILINDLKLIGRQGIQVKGLLGRNPERARNGGAENECFEANSTG